MSSSQVIQLNNVRGLRASDLFADSKSCVKNYSSFNLDFVSDTIIIPSRWMSYGHVWYSRHYNV
jgi:hypothetical protein